jgi:hypothetical protein
VVKESGCQARMLLKKRVVRLVGCRRGGLLRPYVVEEASCQVCRLLKKRVARPLSNLS